MMQVIFKPLLRRNDSKKLFSEFPNNFELSSYSFPKVDLMEDEKFITIIAELPGVNKDDVKIVLEDGVLTLSGEKKSDVKEDDKINFSRNEREFGKFERKFELVEDINPDEVKANFNNGLLKIMIAKLTPEEPKERIIEVK
ncbi:MAG: Hsp20/alpha crystallin family protein [Bacteroidetes bacterium]|nr:Hsp20/alpha crystallin family protein [Bacteroidota bacterium]MCH7770770.1 Hsp20/alpha crystallin family protein [Bacteroidota bacterium]